MSEHGHFQEPHSGAEHLLALVIRAKCLHYAYVRERRGRDWRFAYWGPLVGEEDYFLECSRPCLR